MTEKELEIKYGKQNPFRVPEGYFETLTQEVMSKARMTKKQKSAKVIWFRAVAACAACACVAVFVVSALFNQTVSNDSANLQISDSYIDDAVEYAMLDNGDLYAMMEEDL